MFKKLIPLLGVFLLPIGCSEKLNSSDPEVYVTSTTYVYAVGQPVDCVPDPFEQVVDGMSATTEILYSSRPGTSLEVIRSKPYLNYVFAVYSEQGQPRVEICAVTGQLGDLEGRLSGLIEASAENLQVGKDVPFEDCRSPKTVQELEQSVLKGTFVVDLDETGEVREVTALPKLCVSVA